ncbi:MAG TPA: Uma2 family endonuclease [Terriglobia bacterium]|nr:Uma2 family endonuclease [Terriglobia bacterium]
MGTKTTLSWQEFLAAGKLDQRWEYVDGEVKVMSPSGVRRGLMIQQISVAVEKFVSANPEWMSLPTDVAFTMAGGSWRCPDWSLVRRERLTSGIPEGPAPFPPDVALEVISPNDTWSEIQSKRRDYRENGVVQVWVDPEQRTVEVISPKYGTRTFAQGETVAIGDLPGFHMNLFPPTPGGSEKES